MYERFTDRSRKVMRLANKEALRLGHAELAPEHILLGLMAEGQGVAANVLLNLGVDFARLRNAVERRHPTGAATTGTRELPLTAAARQVVDEALDEARVLNHNYVGTEHLALALALAGDLVATVLADLGVKPAELRYETLMLLGRFELAGPTPE